MRLSKSYAKEEKFRYLRIVVNALRGNTTVFQVSEIKILSKTGESMPWPTETLVTSTMAETSEAESPKKLIDGSVETKFCSAHFSPGAQINIDLKSNVLDRKEYTSWQWFTANDSPERDPVSFELLVSSDGINFTTLDSASNVTITETRNMLAYSGSIGGLPTGYTEVQYIQSTGTQYIDTGVTPGNTTKVEIDFEPTSLDAHHLMILGTRNTSSGGDQFVIGWAGHKSPAVWRSDYGSSQVSFTTTITGVARHYAVKNGASCKIDTETVSNTAATFTSSYTLYLFGGNQANTTVSLITAKLYRCKIYTSDQLVRDFIPCINPDGKVGLYDLISGKFYVNAGAGVFTAGPKVTQPSNDAIYVKVNGIWKQIDGIKLF